MPFLPRNTTQIRIRLRYGTRTKQLRKFWMPTLVIGAPMYNFSISSTLKVWIDHIARAGITFQYTSEGPVGLVSGKKVYLAVATGGVYSSGPYAAYDFLTPYLKHVLAFMGMTDVKILRAEGFAVDGLKETALENGIDGITL